VGLTLDVRQKFRDQILSASKAEVMQAVKECLIPKITTESVRITYASEDLIKKEHILLKENNLPDMQLKQF
jgi:Zn-dependent M16 (insulinase) family peptidase